MMWRLLKEMKNKETLKSGCFDTKFDEKWRVVGKYDGTKLI